MSAERFGEDERRGRLDSTFLGRPLEIELCRQLKVDSPQADIRDEDLPPQLLVTVIPVHLGSEVYKHAQWICSRRES